MSATGLPLDYGTGFAAGEAGFAAAADPASTISLVDRLAAEDLIDDWRELASRAAEENPFLDPDILLPALKFLDARGTVRIATVRRRDGRLAALCPIVRTRLGRLAPAFALFTHPYGPLGVPLLDGIDSESAAEALIAGLATLRPRSALVLPFLPLEGPAAEALRGAAAAARRPVDMFARHRRAMVDRLAGTGTDLRADLAPKKRKELARQMRRLADYGEVGVEMVGGAAEVRNAFEEFLALETSGWKGRNGTALASRPARAAFARDLVFRRSGSGGCRVSALRVGSRPIAMLVSFVGRSTAYTWKIAYDERFARFSPGAQLMLDSATLLLDEPAVQRIDSLAAADHPMIDHLWRERIDLATLVIGPTGGPPLYRLGLKAARVEIEARALAKTTLKQLRRRPNKETPS